MPTINISITDGPGGVTIVVEGDPDLPMPEGELAIEECSPAQALGVGVLMSLSERMGGFDWRSLLR